MMTAVDLVSLPSHLVGQCSDMHIRMMHIQHPAKQQQDLESFYNLREEESFCDMTFVTTNDKGDNSRRSIKVHSLVIAASSDFLKNWMESTFVADLKYEVILPDTDFTNLQSLINILYGVDVAIPQNRLDQLHNLADMLGITVDLPFRIVEQSFNDVDVADMNGGDQLNQISNLVTMSVGGEKPPEFTDLEDENAGVDVLPLCCWHCNRAFADLEELKTHVKTHKGERFKSKRHKCQKCKKILPSMWKLRQHLLTHASSMPKRRYGAGPAADHGYATSQKSSAPFNNTSNSNLTPHGTPQKDASKDHPYATMNIPRTRSNMQNDAVDTPPLSLVSSEHSYGTRLKNNQEDEASGNLDLMGGSNSRDRRYDHPYSAWENPNSHAVNPLSSPSVTPKKLKLKSKRTSNKQKVVTPSLDRFASSKPLSNKTKRARTLSSRLRKREEENEKMKNPENASNVTEILDHQYASNQNSEKDFHVSPKGYSVSNTQDSEPYSNLPTRTPSPPRGAAKRKASLNLQRARSRAIIQTSDPKNKQPKVQFEKSLTTERTVQEQIHSIVDISNLNPQETRMKTEENPHLVVRLHPLKTVATSLQSTGSLPNKLPIPALPNSRTRAGNKRKGPTETNFPCSQCTKIFPQRYRRARHIREVHDKEKRHQCGTCEKSFFKVTSKERHELTHLKNRTTQWNCTLCSRSFSDESSLVYHVKNRVCVKRGIAKL